MRDAAVVAGRLHGIVDAQRLVAAGLVQGGLRFQVAERRRQAVAAVLARRPAQQPQGILQPGGQGGEAFAAQHHLAVLPAGEGQTEMVKPVRQWRARHRDPEAARVGEVG